MDKLLAELIFVISSYLWSFEGRSFFLTCKRLYKLSKRKIPWRDSEMNLIQAARQGNTTLLGELLERGVDVNKMVKIRKGNGDMLWTGNALHVGAWSGQLDIVQLLLRQEGLNINIYTDNNEPHSNQNNALHMACVRGHTEVVKILVDYPNTNVNIQNVCAFIVMFSVAFSLKLFLSCCPFFTYFVVYNVHRLG